MGRANGPTIDLGEGHGSAMNAAVYLDGGLSRRVVRWFEHHLLECEDCWREVWLARRGRFLAEHARELAPATLRDSVRGAIELSAEEDANEQQRRGRLRLLWWRR
jgi:hypothetical protein